MKRFVSAFTLVVLLGCMFLFMRTAFQSPANPLTREMVINAEKLIGLTFTDAKRDSMFDGLKQHLDNYEQIRRVHLDNSIPPAILFNPIPVGMKFQMERRSFG